MSRLLRNHPSPAMVVALVALFVALGGTGYAVSYHPSGQGAAHVAKKKKRKKKSKQVLAKCAAATTIVCHSTTPGPAGPQGTRGPTGPTGPTGPAGTNAATHAVVRTATTSVADNASDIASAHCNPGEVAVGGGGSFLNTDPPAMEWIQRTGPTKGNFIASPGDTPDGWFARGFNHSGAPNDLTAFAICVSP